ncbi:protein kinase domain-containing protein [Rubripirellula amarantea]|nr:protein kinase [Rubripirellula amarantea]
MKDAHCFGDEAITTVLGNTTSPDDDDFELVGLDFAHPYGAELSECPRYRVNHPIGFGGMGVIYDATDTYFNRNVALKVLRDDYVSDVRMVKRFVHEARTTAKLQHPGIAPVYDMGETSEGCPYFSMQLIRGETLASLVSHADSSPLQQSRELGVFASVCQTIAYAHSQGVVHLDLKPSNIMVGLFGQVRVVDWGLSQEIEDLAIPFSAREESSSANETTDASLGKTRTAVQITGTLAYMPPEQARGEQIGSYSDVFGLGAILCEILTGEPPFSVCNVNKAYQQAVTASLTHAFERLDHCGSERRLIDLAKVCLSSEPGERPCDAKSVASAITAHVEQSMIHAEEDLHQFFEISMDMFCIASLDGYFKRVNSNFTRVLGYTETQLISEPFMALVHPDDRDRTLEVVSELASGNCVIDFQNRYLDSEGHYHWFEWTAKSLPEQNMIFAIAKDITQRVKLDNLK